MRKRIITQGANDVQFTDQEYLDLEKFAQVEITSEDPAFPIESALSRGESKGWRALNPGRQTIRIIFNDPQNIKRIHLQFDENTQSRTHEFVILWSSGDKQSYHEILRQQFTFSPPNTTREVEDYVINLTSVKELELRIVPNINDNKALASLTNIKIV